MLAQLPNPTLQKPAEQLQALGNARITVKNPIFLLKRKGWELLLLDIPSGMEQLQDADPKGSCHTTACTTCGVQPHPPGQCNTPKAPRSLEMAGIPQDPAALPGMLAPAFPQSKQTVAKSQQNHESKTTEPQSASESLLGRRHGPTALPKFASTCSC